MRSISTITISQMFCKIGKRKNCVELTGNYLYWSLLLMKIEAPATLLKRDSSTSPAKFINKRHRYRCFPVTFAELEYLQTTTFLLGIHTDALTLSRMVGSQKAPLPVFLW